MLNHNFSCVSNGDISTICWHLYSGERMPMATIKRESIYCGDFCSSSIDFGSGSLSCSAWCDALTGKGALPISDEKRNTVAVLSHKSNFPKPGTRWTLEYDCEFYHIEVREDRQRNLDTILVYDPVPELRGEMMCFHPLAYIENPKDRPEYSGLVTQRLPMQLCMAIVWLPYIMGIAMVSK